MIDPVLIKKNTIRSEYLQEEIIDLLGQTFAIPKSFGFKMYKTSKEHIARPDLISLDVYGDTMFADVICKLNGLSNPFELNEDMYLILPNPDEIMKFTFNVPTNDPDNEENNTAPKPKAKKEKRKANESVVGDSRFKIDPVMGVVIY